MKVTRRYVPKYNYLESYPLAFARLTHSGQTKIGMLSDHYRKGGGDKSLLWDSETMRTKLVMQCESCSRVFDNQHAYGGHWRSCKERRRGEKRKNEE